MQIRFLSFVLFFLAVASSTFAQKEANIWHYGQGQGIDFTNGFTPITGSMQTPEGCASICDAEGNLLFYTNGGAKSGNSPIGGFIWDKNGDVLLDMGDDGGGVSAVQSSLFIPNPANENLYYLFTMDEQEAYFPINEGNGLSYYEIDKNGNGGLGEVINYEEAIVANSYEVIAGTAHANETDYWVVVGDLESSEFKVFLVDLTGVNLVNTLPFSEVGGLVGLSTIKISPNGKWLATSETVFEFDNETGLIANPTILDKAVVEFSPNSQYVFTVNSTSLFTDFNIFRYDLTTTDVLASEELLGNFTFGVGNNGLIADFQIGPDGNIYFLELYGDMFPSEFSFNTISVIRCPNAPTPCIEQNIFLIDLETLNGEISTGFPDFLSHFLTNNSVNQELPLVIEASNTAFCEEPTITLNASLADLENYAWSTGETTSSITISEGGIYAVTVTEGCCSVGIAQIEISDQPEELFFELEAEGSLDCGESVTLNLATNAEIISWSTGDTTTQVLISEAGTYAVIASNACEEISEEVEVIPSELSTQPAIPNAFTPNEDGSNDTFGLLLDCPNFQNYSMKIYNRWGQTVFRTNDLEQQWDGTVDNQVAQTDVYFYLIQYTTLDDETGEMMGDVTLIR